MCMPHGSAQTYNSTASSRRDKAPKKHIAFDKTRMKPDPDFIDERVSSYKAPEKEKSFFSKFFE